MGPWPAGLRGACWQLRSDTARIRLPAFTYQPAGDTANCPAGGRGGATGCNQPAAEPAARQNGQNADLVTAGTVEKTAPSLTRTSWHEPCRGPATAGTR